MEDRFWQGCLAPALLLAGLFALLCAFSCVKMEQQVASCVVPVRFVLQESGLPDVVGADEDDGYLSGAGSLSGRTYSISEAKSVDESLLKDINLYVVDEAGAVLSHEFITARKEAAVTIYEGNKYKVFAVANWGKAAPLASESEILALKGGGGPTGGSGLGGSNAGSGSGEAGGVLMSGKLPLQVLSGKKGITVPLTRAVAKISLKADYSGLNEGVSIVVDKVSLCNIPREVSLFGENRLVAADEAFVGESRDGVSRGEMETGISFYQFENLQGELLKGNQVQTGKVWPEGSVYASTCSYVELRGRYSSAAKEGEIAYRFYLGSNMLSNFDVKRNTHYSLTVNFTGDGSIDENTWRVDVSGLEDVIPPDVSFEKSSVFLYDLEEAALGFATLDTRGKEMSVVSSNSAVVKVLGYDNSGVRLQGVAPGSAVITVRVGDAVASCTVTVEKLRIVPGASFMTMYNHFYEDIPYTIYPAHAAALGVSLSSSSVGLVTGYSGVAARVIPQFSSSEDFPKREKLTLSVAGRSDVSAEIDVMVQPVLQVAGSIVVNANMGSQAAVKSLGIQAAPRAQLQYSWLPANGTTVQGDPGENAVVSLQGNKITFPIPNGANGEYVLKLKVVGDDGYGENEMLHTDAVQYCKITVYETIYLVGISKTQNRTKIDSYPDKWLYENEVVAKWLSHPNSLLFPEGELSLDIGFVYNGTEYDADHTDFLEEFTFEFEDGEEIPIEMGEKTVTYKGSAPMSYFAYFYLQPVVSPYIAGNIAEGKPYLYIYSRNFASGFSTSVAPNWKRIFEYVYR